MRTETPLLDAISPSPDETKIARDSGRRLAALLESDVAGQKTGVVRVSINGDGGEEVVLPAAAVRLLARLLLEMGEGHAVKLLPISTELSTQGAAEILNVSRPYVVRLLDDGEIPSRKVGTHRRVLLRDVLDFKQRDKERRLKIMDELTALSQEMGFY